MQEQNKILIQKLISCIDLTSLNDDDTADDIKNLCQRAQTPLGDVAAVCVHLPFVAIARQSLPSHMHVATVINFPAGTQALSACEADIKTAIDAGANEIDIVMPYALLLQHKNKEVAEFLMQCRNATNNHCLKIIIESGALVDEAMIHQACELVLAARADFIKTSTGKINTGATLLATELILTALQQHQPCQTGIKISGGVRNFEQAAAFYQQAKQFMGNTWLTPQHFRIGASSLLKTLLHQT